MGSKDKQRDLRYECNTGRSGELTIDTLTECIQELRASAVPGRARVKVQGDGVRSLGFSVTASWSAPAPATEGLEITVREQPDQDERIQP